MTHAFGNCEGTGLQAMDRFGRVKDCYWYDYGSSTDVLRIKHAHDRTGNRLYREEADTSDLDQLYSYDDVNRLTQSQEGTLGAGKDTISSLNFAQQWSLDATGNWSGFKEDDDGDSTWDLDQTRTSNAVNEITDVTETAGPSWLTPAYNRAGNMTTIPQPGNPTQSYTATYNAWNRLVKLVDGQDTVAEYIFDGTKRLVVRKKYVSGSLNQTRHFYHTAQWQTIEERLESGGSISSTADRQFTWGLRYIDDLVCRTVSSSHDYAYQDANWNVVLSSSALARVGYESYGQVRSTCAAAQGNLDAWQHYFAGYRRDEDTGLYLVRHRVYQPVLGGWVQRDPMAFMSQDVNLYRYVRNWVTRAIDPSGEKLYAVFGTWADPGEETNVEFLCDHYSGQCSKFHGPDEAVTGADAVRILKKVHKAVCWDFCASRRLDKSFQVDLIGWSRGAVIAATVAKKLNDEGCCCKYRTVGRWERVRGGGQRFVKYRECCDLHKPVPVNFVGLFDAVRMTIPGLGAPQGGWAEVFPPNVTHAAHAVKTAVEPLFPTQMGFVPAKSFRRYNGMPATHGDIGTNRENNGAFWWMVAQARAAGLQFEIPGEAPLWPSSA